MHRPDFGHSVRMTGEEFDRLVPLLDALLTEATTQGSQNPALVQPLPTWTFKRTGESAYSMHTEMRNLILWPGTNLYEWIASLKTYPAVAAILATSDVMANDAKERITGAANSEAALDAWISAFVKDFVESSLRRDEWAVHQERKQRCLEAMRALLVNNEKTHRIMMFVHGITLPQDLHLDGGLVMRPPTEDELQAAFRTRISTGAHEAILNTGVVIEGTERVRRNNRSVLSDRASAVLTALRIWTRRPVDAIATYEAEGPDAMGRGSVRVGNRSWFGTGEPLSDPMAFQAFWTRTKDIAIRPPSALGVALRRVDLMVEQQRRADRVLDLCIILEALFQLGGEQQELAYRLSLRTAHFIGGTRAQRQETFKTVKDGYGLRSKIAHGASSGASDTSAQERLEHVVFNALKLYCERAPAYSNDDAHKNIVNELDGYLLERSTDRE